MAFQTAAQRGPPPMLRKALVARIERAEQTAQGQSILAPECICFPPDERTFFGFPIEEQIAAKVRCPLDMVGEQPNRDRIEPGVALAALRARAGGSTGVVTVRFDLLGAYCFATGKAGSLRISVRWRVWCHTVIVTRKNASPIHLPSALRGLGMFGYL